MTVVLVFLATLMFVFVGWLVAQSIGVQPWVASTAGITAPPRDIQSQPDTKVALVVLLAVLTSLFALFMSAYVIRMELADWRPVPEPDLLWLNTLVLALGSLGMHWAYSQSGRDSSVAGRSGALRGLLFAGACLALFVIGQYMAWQQLRSLGYFATTNPANAFFYLITGLHVIHILGGLVFWAVTTSKVLQASDLKAARLNIQLCGIYIHFLLIVWFVLFALLLRT